jgi:hypothetical protein
MIILPRTHVAGKFLSLSHAVRHDNPFSVQHTVFLTNAADELQKVSDKLYSGIHRQGVEV